MNKTPQSEGVVPRPPAPWRVRRSAPGTTGRVIRVHPRKRPGMPNRRPATQPLKINPALKPLEVFVGDWDMELSNASFLPDPQTTVHGPIHFRWVQAGAFLVMYHGAIKAPQATWLMGRDDLSDSFTVLYFDARRVSRVYEMSLTDAKWRMWRNSKKFSQRFEGVFSKDRTKITATWRKSNDGKQWQHDFDVTYTKKK